MTDREQHSPPQEESAHWYHQRAVKLDHQGGRVLIVEDEIAVRSFICDLLATRGYTTIEADSIQKAQQQFLSSAPDVVVLDYLLPDGHALDLLPRLHDIDPDVLVLILTGFGTIELAVRAIKAGAANFLTKPIDNESLLVVVDRLLKQSRDRRRHLASRSIGSKERLNPFLGDSPAIQRLRDEAERFVDTTSPVLIEGETGVGKGVLARWIHQNGPRAQEPFVEINCAGLTSAFLDAELFGHCKGAFTGATMAKPGLFEVADHGTIFLDEIAEVDVQIQPKLLKVLEEMRFRRLGEVRDRTTDVRLVAATNRDLASLAEAGQFRQDLYFRVSVLPLHIPPLRERSDDVRWIAQVMLRRIALDLGRPAAHIAEDAFAAMHRYPWPGNLRELRNVLERAVLLSDQDLLDTEHLRIDGKTHRGMLTSDLSLSLQEVEEQYIKAVLADVDGHVGDAAERLGIPRSTLYKRLKSLQEDPTADR